jgi:formiminotetrahydrofolate cyclodeaminase
MQERLKEAAEVPFKIAERCARVVALALPAARMGNKWAVSDAGVGALLGEASLHSALLNVEINLASIKDPAYVETMRGRMTALVEEAVRVKAEVMEVVHKTINP